MEDLKANPSAHQSASSVVGVGLDSCVMKTRHEGVFLVQTTDFFYPLIDDPYVMGKIACANVLSDLYAMGVTECDNMLMLLSLSLTMTPAQRAAVTPLLIRGFNDQAREAGTSVNGGQTVLNPWVIVGGVASSVASREEFIIPDGAVEGDVLVLTKPLGTQVAVNANQWLNAGHEEHLARLCGCVEESEIRRTYRMATHSMARLNRTAARLLHKYGAHCATDVTGFGLIGHARNLAQSQKNHVAFSIHTLPLLRNVAKIAQYCTIFRILDGHSAETSGGLLVALPRKQAEGFIEEICHVEGEEAWIVGDVIAGEREAFLSDEVSLLEINTKEEK